MKRRGMGLFLVGALVLVPGFAWSQPGAGKQAGDAQDDPKEVKPQAKIAKIDPTDRAAVLALSRRIDELLAASWENAGIKPAPPATDGEYIRRLHLDLVGKIPEMTEVSGFIDHMSEFESEWGWLATRDVLAAERLAKRWQWVEDKILGMQIPQPNNPAEKRTYFARHWSAVFRSVMLPSTAASNPQFGNLQPGFENWLQQKLDAGAGYDKITYELLTGNPNDQRVFNGGFGGGPGMGGGSPAGFYFANENKAENLAGAVGRVFLGVKIECAQCHAHPFAKWQQQQFWEFAAFFSGVQNPFNPNPRGGGRPVNPNSRKIAIPGTNKEASAKFLDGTEPVWKDGMDTRTVLADWVISPDNPYFARASVDTVWTYFFGHSLLEPIVEPNDDYPVTYPELLDELSKQFIASGHDLKFLIRAIVHSEAYQRSSEGGKEANKLDYFFFARMPVRALSPEQLFDSFAEATRGAASQLQPSGGVNQFGQQMTPRQDFINRFSTIEKRTESSTSILQALFLMNGKLVNERVKLEVNSSLASLAKPTAYFALGRVPTARKVKFLYMMVLSRHPRAEESDRLVRYIDSGGPSRNSAQALTDVYWALLNSAEFMLNH